MRYLALLAPLVFLAACGNGTDTATRPATNDVGSADAHDAAADAAFDATTDGPADAANDAAADAVTDSAVDAGEVTDDGLLNGCPTYPTPVDTMGADPHGDTWADFAQGFFTRWCVRCHSDTLTSPEARSGAPAMLNWNVEATVRSELMRIRTDVGVTNYMPFNPPRPPCEERRRLIRWIDIGAP